MMSLVFGPDGDLHFKLARVSQFTKHGSTGRYVGRRAGAGVVFEGGRIDVGLLANAKSYRSLVGSETQVVNIGDRKLAPLPAQLFCAGRGTCRGILGDQGQCTQYGGKY